MNHKFTLRRKFLQKGSKQALYRLGVSLAVLVLVSFQYDAKAVAAARTNTTVQRPQQSIRITGTVVSATDKMPLTGAVVTVKGTTTGTITDLNGKFSIDVPNANSVLSVSFIGFVKQEVILGDQQTLEIALVEESRNIEEVVVIGYQTVSKKDLTGSVAVVNSKLANKTVSGSLGEALQGLSSGVTVKSSGKPGETASIEIRGAASFTNTSPLYIIDGMIADANSTVNNNDIESIQILKDASAAAIYGSRAANGVIIITTKQGTEGATKVEFSSKFGLQQIPKRWKLMNSTEFANMQKTQYQNSGLTPPTSITSGFDPSISTDWQDEVMKNGYMQDYNISLSGGSKTSKFLMSTSYFKNTGVLIGNDFERLSFRINSSTKKGIFTIGENLLLTNSVQNQPDQGNPFYDMPQMLPIFAVKSSKYITSTNPAGWGFGTVDEANYAWNPVAVNDITSRRNNYSKAIGNFFVEAKLFDWLSYKFNAGLEASFDLSKTISKDGVWRFNSPSYPSSVSENRSKFTNLLFEHTLNFNKKMGEHSINGVIGISEQHFSRDNTYGGRSNMQVYSGEYLTTIGSALGSQVSDGSTTKSALQGYLGRLNYNYADRYFLSLTGRIDKDSRFGEKYRTGYFPSVAAGWKINKEKFFHVDWVSNLKLNASYGELGIVTVSPWEYTAYENSNPTVILGSAQAVNNGITQARLANENLRWENRIVRNVGLDLGLFNNTVEITAELYNSLSKDALLYLPVAGYLGNLGGDPPVNAGSIRNKGLDLNITYRGTSKDFKWDATANITTIKNTVESVGNSGKDANGKVIDYIQAGNTRTQVGRSLGEWYVLRTDGLFKSQAEIDSYVDKTGKKIQPNAKPGDIKYKDLDGNGTINNNDRDFAGTPWPSLQTGLILNASYKDFSLNLQFTGVFGYKVYNDVRRILDSYQRTNMRSDINPWSASNPNGTDPRIAVDTDQGIIMNNLSETDRWLENASYVRLRNLELGYNLPKSLVNKLKIDNLRLTFSAQNLFTITKYKGLDPAVTGNGILERGVDNGYWPSSRGYYFGIQMGL